MMAAGSRPTAVSDYSPESLILLVLLCCTKYAFDPRVKGRLTGASKAHKSVEEPPVTSYDALDTN
jgi:hypothetical protein